MTKQQIGNFRIVERIGEGGMGEVFHAVDTMLERQVALKTLRPELSAHEDLVERFRVEAIALARLNHPNIAAVYSFFREDDRYHMAMQFVQGATLEHVLKMRTRLTWQEAAQIGIEVLLALEHAHAMGVIHRDLKPANLMLDPDGHTVVMDFGIARVLSMARQTRAGNMVGTLEYIAPEIVRGEAPSPQADLYSLGVVLFELVTGRLPFIAETDFAMMRAHVEQAPPLPTALSSELPPAFEAVILRALAKTPKERFACAREFLVALAAAAEIDAPGTRVTQALSPHMGVPKQQVFGSLVVFYRWFIHFLPPSSGGKRAWMIWVRGNPGLSVAAVAGVVALGFVFAGGGHPGQLSTVRPASTKAPSVAVPPPVRTDSIKSADAPLVTALPPAKSGSTGTPLVTATPRRSVEEWPEEGARPERRSLEHQAGQQARPHSRSRPGIVKIEPSPGPGAEVSIERPKRKLSAAPSPNSGSSNGWYVKQ